MRKETKRTYKMKRPWVRSKAMYALLDWRYLIEVLIRHMYDHEGVNMNLCTNWQQDDDLTTIESLPLDTLRKMELCTSIIKNIAQIQEICNVECVGEEAGEQLPEESRLGRIFAEQIREFDQFYSERGGSWKDGMRE